MLRPAGGRKEPDTTWRLNKKNLSLGLAPAPGWRQTPPGAPGPLPGESDLRAPTLTPISGSSGGGLPHLPWTCLRLGAEGEEPQRFFSGTSQWTDGPCFPETSELLFAGG